MAWRNYNNRMSPTKKAYIAGLKVGKRIAYRKKKKGGKYGRR